jgi:hypothetical protein
MTPMEAERLFRTTIDIASNPLTVILIFPPTIPRAHRRMGRALAVPPHAHGHAVSASGHLFQTWPYVGQDAEQ